MHNFVLRSNESACRKIGRLGMEQVIHPQVTLPTSPRPDRTTAYTY